MVIDACIWVSLLNSDDIFHNQVVAWFREAQGSFDIPSISLAEVAGAISRRTHDPSLAKQAVEFLKNELIRIHDVDEALADGAAKQAAKHSLRGYDSVYVALAKKLKTPLVTLDKELCDRKLGIDTLSP